jgi:hypothetical protein
LRGEGACSTRVFDCGTVGADVIVRARYLELEYVMGWKGGKVGSCGLVSKRSWEFTTRVLSFRAKTSGQGQLCSIPTSQDKLAESLRVLWVYVCVARMPIDLLVKSNLERRLLPFNGVTLKNTSRVVHIH